MQTTTTTNGGNNNNTAISCAIETEKRLQKASGRCEFFFATEVPNQRAV